MFIDISIVSNWFAQRIKGLKFWYACLLTSLCFFFGGGGGMLPVSKKASAKSMVDKTFGQKNRLILRVFAQHDNNRCCCEKKTKVVSLVVQVSALGLETLSDPEAFLSSLAWRQDLKLPGKR